MLNPSRQDTQSENNHPNSQQTRNTSRFQRISQSAETSPHTILICIRIIQLCAMHAHVANSITSVSLILPKPKPEDEKYDDDYGDSFIQDFTEFKILQRRQLKCDRPLTLSSSWYSVTIPSTLGIYDSNTMQPENLADRWA